MIIKMIQGNGEHVLIVDDDEVLRDLATEILRTLGYTAVAVASGEQAVQYLMQNQADLVMLDMVMSPGINGRETYERVLAFRPGQRAIVVSGFAESSEISRTLQLGANQLVKKTIYRSRAWIDNQDSLARLKRG